MPTFQVKRVQTSLFGVIEAANQSPWLEAFAGSGATTSIDLDGAALDLIADELELDAEGLAADASRYVGGLYRPKARGMGGSQLGSEKMAPEEGLDQEPRRQRRGGVG